MAIFLLVSAITALSVFAIERVEARRAEAQHRQMTDTIVTAIERLANANAVYLRAGASMIASHRRVPESAFREFARQLQRDENLRSGGALAYAPLVRRAALDAFTAEQRRRTRPGYTVRSQGTGPYLLPVEFIAPEGATSATALGFDILGEPVRRAALLRAMRSGNPTASGTMELLVDPHTHNRTAFAIFMPVLAGTPPRTALRGVIARGFNAQAFLDTALPAEQRRGYGVALFDGDGAHPVLLASRGHVARPSESHTRTFLLARHPMRLAVVPPKRSTLSNLSLITLVFGMMVAALLLVVARLVTQQAAEDRAALAWFEEQASIRNSLTRELNHRVKNTLANVLSIVALTRRRTSDINAFIDGLTGRIRALSATHDLLTESDWGTTPIRAVIGAELAPYSQDSEGAVRLEGPHLELAPSDALSLGLAVHELATNASKYGALSVAGGRAAVDWAPVGPGLVRVEWRECGGPPVPAARRRGFGTELIEKIVAHELRNPVDLDFAPEGVRCRITVPVRMPVRFQMRAPREGSPAEGPLPPGPDFSRPAGSS